MDLSQSLSSSARWMVRYLSLLGLSVTLFGCAAAPAQQSPETKVAPATNEEIVAEQAKRAEKVFLPLSPELIYYVLTAEIAGQRGEMSVAVDLYDRAAEMIDSPALASRSAQVATYSRDQGRINRALKRWLEVEPEAADVHIMQTPFLILQDDFQGVVNATNKAISLEPEKGATYLLRLSESLTELSTPEHSISIFQQLQCYQDGKAYARLAFARLAAFFKHYNEALAELDILQRDNAENEEYLVLRADILQRTERSDEALKLIAKAAQKSSASDELKFSYGKLLGETGKHKQARTIFEDLHNKNPQNRDVLYALGLLALEDKQAKQAKSYFSQILKLGDPSHQTEYFMGLAEESLGNNDAALVWFASVPVQSHRFDLAQTHYINLLAEQGDISRARDHLAFLRKQQPNQAVQYYLFESGFLRERGMSRQAFDLLTEALKHRPENNDLLYGRAMVAESLDKLDVLEADLRNILSREPENPQALNALGYTLTDRTERHEEALALIEKALSIKPDDPFYLDSLGWVYYRMGNLQKAQLYLEQAIALQPDLEFIAHLGEVLWEQGKKDQALKVWRQGLQRDADNELLLKTMQRYGQ